MTIRMLSGYSARANGITFDSLGNVFVTGRATPGTGGDHWITRLGSVPVAITMQPTNLALIQGQAAVFTVVATGTPSLSYQWRKQGQPISGATNSAFSIPNVLPADAGVYSVLVTDVAGSVASEDATLSVLPTVPLAFALNTSNLTWTTDWPNFWFGQTAVSHDGLAAAQSMAIAAGEQSALRTTIIGPATLSFWWKVSSQTNADFLTFAVTGNPDYTAAISGETGWRQASFLLPAGSQSLSWTYAKDGSLTSVQDAGWVDEVVVRGGGTAPLLLTQPTSQVIFPQGAATFSASASGTPALNYQWRFIGTNLAGATGSALALNPVHASDAGAYSIIVSNDYGQVTSSNAQLTFVPILGIGNNSFGQSAVPVITSGVMAVSAGAWHNLLLRSAGKVVAWGDDSAGQCDTPTNLIRVVGIAAGGYHSLALTAEGAVVGWGANDSGQISVPSPLSNVIAVTAGTWHSLALRSDGKVIAWGDNTWGQTRVPSMLTNAIAIAAGEEHSLALRGDGTVVAWGGNLNADGVFVGQSLPPLGLSNIVAIGAGDYHSLAVTSDGRVVGWGDNTEGQLQPPNNLAGVTAVAGGGAHSMALRADGTVACWGLDADGQCNIPATLTNAIAISAGGLHSLVLVETEAGLLRILYPMRKANQFSVWTRTLAGKNYALQYRNSFAGTNWTALPTIRGNSVLQLLNDSAATDVQRFYRVREW
jgi:hypothetical protein